MQKIFKSGSKAVRAISAEIGHLLLQTAKSLFVLHIPLPRLAASTFLVSLIFRQNSKINNN
jgi:hypothetical protein